MRCKTMHCGFAGWWVACMQGNRKRHLRREVENKNIDKTSADRTAPKAHEMNKAQTRGY